MGPADRKDNTLSTPYERWKLGMAMITTQVGPETDRGPKLAALFADADMSVLSDAIAGTLDVAGKLLAQLAKAWDMSDDEVLQFLARMASDQYG